MSETGTFCCFEVAELLLGLPVAQVQEVVAQAPITPVPLAPPYVEGLINLRGHIATAIDLRRRFELPRRPASAVPVHIVLGDGRELVSLLADRVGDVVEAALDAYEPPPENLRSAVGSLVEGVYKLEARLLLVLDLPRVLASAEARAPRDS